MICFSLLFGSLTTSFQNFTYILCSTHVFSYGWRSFELKVVGLISLVPINMYQYFQSKYFGLLYFANLGSLSTISIIVSCLTTDLIEKQIPIEGYSASSVWCNFLYSSWVVSSSFLYCHIHLSTNVVVAIIHMTWKIR